MGGSREIWIAAGALSALAAILSGQARADELVKSGVAAFTLPQVEAVRADGSSVPLRVGDAVFGNQRIVTDARGRLQVVLLDRSTITIGPDSDITIDEFRFEQESGTGKLVLNAAKGLFRFVGGLLSKRNPVEVKTPTATIGIRGAIVYVSLSASGALQVSFFYGDQVTVTMNDGSQEVLARPGFMLEIPDPASSAFTISRVPPELIAGFIAQLEGATGQSLQVQEVTDTGEVLVLELDGTDDIDLQELEDALGISDASFEETRERLEELGTTGDTGSGGGG